MNGELLILFIILLLALILCSFLGGKKCEGMVNNQVPIYYTSTNGTSTTTAALRTEENGKLSIVFTDSFGTQTIFKQDQTQSQTAPNGGTLISFTAPNGSTANMMTTVSGNSIITVTIASVNSGNPISLIVDSSTTVSWAKRFKNLTAIGPGRSMILKILFK